MTAPDADEKDPTPHKAHVAAPDVDLALPGAHGVHAVAPECGECAYKEIY